MRRLRAESCKNDGRYKCAVPSLSVVPGLVAFCATVDEIILKSQFKIRDSWELRPLQRNHCVKVQFAWQRGASPLPGGLTELHSPDPSLTDAGNAPGNETSGTWVRVAEALAGPNWGSQFTPRIGTEVLWS